MRSRDESSGTKQNAARALVPVHSKKNPSRGTRNRQLSDECPWICKIGEISVIFYSGKSWRLQNDFKFEVFE